MIVQRLQWNFLLPELWLCLENWDCPYRIPLEFRLPVSGFSQLRICILRNGHILLLLRNGHIYMKDANTAESNEKSFFRFFRFLFLELWLILFRIYGDTQGVPSPKKNSCSKEAKLFKNSKLFKRGQICMKNAHSSEN